MLHQSRCVGYLATTGANSLAVIDSEYRISPTCFSRSYPPIRTDKRHENEKKGIGKGKKQSASKYLSMLR